MIRGARRPRALLAACALLVAVGGGACAPSSNETPTRASGVATLERLPVASHEIEVLDGDTVRWNEHVCRIVGYDTPEQRAEWFEGDQEPWATRATNRLRDALESATELEILVVDEPDSYGRKLVQIYADDVPIGVPLLEAGLAYPTIAVYGDNGLPEDARAIVDAARRGRHPEFEDPRLWRRAHRIDR
jgi:endonuclease YncB( thermonuclease family)